MRVFVFAIALFLPLASGASAACNVTATSIASHLASGAHTETDCASAADVAALQGVTIDHEGRIVALETNDGLQDTALASQAATLADHETRIADGEAKDVEQDARHDAAEVKNDEQDGRLDSHDADIATHTTQIAGAQAKNVEQDGRLGSLETITDQHEGRLGAHDALLSEHAATLGSHSRKLEDHAKGLAIAMAMPDAWLSDKKSFGIFGSVGGFDDETAVGFAAIGRIDETFSLNAKIGGDTEFKQFGWQVGAGAQW